MCSKNYASIGLDAGTYANQHFLETAIIDPYKQQSLLYETFPVGSLDLIGYRNFGEALCNKLSGHNISLLAFVGDNLRSQVAGLGHWKKNSLQQMNNKFCSILFINCCCHSFNRSVVDVIEKNEQLKSYISKLNTIIVLLRKQETIGLIKLVAKSLIETRWVYIFDVAYFLIKHRERINNVISTHKESITFQKEKYKFIQNGIPSFVDDIANLFYPIKLLITALSSDWAKLWHLVPMFSEAISIIDESIEKNYYKNSEFLEYANELKSETKNRYFNTCRVELAQSAYLLTKNGRYDFRKKVELSVVLMKKSKKEMA